MRTTTRLAAAVGAVVLMSTLAAGPAAARGHTPPTGTTSLASVLAADGDRFDRRWHDYDVVTEAVGAVLAAKPSSPVALLADGSVPLTAFLPNDRAFQLLVKDLTGRWQYDEQKVFETVAGLGVDTVETVLLYHVVPGATIDKRAAAGSDGAVLTTAQGGAVTVDVLSRWVPVIRLVDADTDDADPLLNPFALDINKGNVQIAHGVLLVLRPADL